MTSTNLLRVCVLFALAAFAVATADNADAGLFGRLRGGDCCCQTSCCDNGGFLTGLRDRVSNDCCCEAEPVCPCEAAPACPCEAAPAVVEDCGCAEAAPCCEAEPCCNSGIELGGKLKCHLGGLRGRFTGCGC